MILFVGKKEKGFFCDDIAKKRGLDTIYITENLHIESQAKEILHYKEEASWVIIDIEQYADDPEILENWIIKIKDAINVGIIIYAPGYTPKSTIIYELYQKGIKNFVFSFYLSDQKEDFEYCLDGYFESFGYEMRGFSFEQGDETEGDGRNEQEKNSGVKMIGFAGAVARMGTTSQAIQFIRYLQFNGYKAAYIQMNNHKWVEALADAYFEAEHDTEKGVVSYHNIDMYYRLDRLPDVKKKDYDFWVYDYGVFSDYDFNKVSFLEKEIQIFVVGSKPGEFAQTYNVIKNNFYNEVFYIFNFVAKSEQKDLLELMEEKRESTFFAGDVRDPFVFSGEDGVFEKILPLKKQAETTRKTKFSFGKRKNK